MAETIRGINVQIGADTTKLGKALENVNAKSKSIQSELRQVERLLKFDPGNTEALAQKQKLLAEQISTTSEKLNKLKSVQQQVNEQFQRGEISEAKYRAFRREIEFTESSLSSLKTRLAETEKEQQNIAKSTKQLETLLQAAGKEVDGLADVLGGKLTNALLQGKASSKQLEEAIEKIGRAALGTNVDLDKLKKALSSVDDGNSLKNVKKELGQLVKEADEAKKSVGDLGVEIENVAGALVAGGGIAGAIDQALDVSSLNTKIDVAFEVPEESKQAVKEAVRSIEAYGVDAEAALDGVRRQWALNKNASDEANSAIVKGAAAIASAYSGIDFAELIQETNEIASELNISQEEALGLTNALLKMGFPPEQLDIIAEYGGQLERAGFSAQEVQAIMSAGVETGTWNIDNLLDGLKEGRIRVAEFGDEVPKALKELLKGTDISAKQMQTWGQAVAEGGEGGSQAMREIAEALNTVDDETKKNLIGAQIFGTMYEDQGQNIIDTLINAKDTTVDFKENQDQLNESIGDMDASPAVQLQQAFADLKTASEPMLEVIANVVSTIASWVSENPQLAATLASIATVVGVLMGAIIALAPVFTAISTAAGALGVGIGAIAGPIGIVIAAIAALIAIGISVYQNWDSIQEFLINTWDSIKSTGESIWNGLTSFLSSAWEGIKVAASVVWNGIKDYFGTVFNDYKTIFATVWNAIKIVVTTIWNALKLSATSNFNAIKIVVSTISNTIQTVVTSVWNGILSVISSIWNGIKNTSTSIWNGIKNVVSNVVSGISSNVSSTFNTIKSVVTSIWNGIKTAITSPIESAKNTVLNIISTIKNAFSNLSIKIPKPKLPKFNVEWKKFGVGDLSVKVPNFNISWHKVGGVFTKPVVAGNAGFGDVEEAIVPFEGKHASRIAGLIGKEMLNELQVMFKPEKTQQLQAEKPIILQVDGKTFAQITGNYYSQEGGVRVRRIERGLA